MSMISTAEKKRLQSLKEKKHAFKKREEIIQEALANLHNTTNNKKIIFDDNFGEEQNSRSKEEKKINLFEDDGNDEDPLWNKDTFNTTKHKKKEDLSEVNYEFEVTLGHDARFTLDERFAEDDHQNETEVIASDVQCDLQKEKERELDILEEVLGAPFAMKSQQTKTSKEEMMVRYDPTEKKHCEYEMKLTQSETKEKSTKKKKHEKAKIEEPVPVEVSKEVYYTVSDTLIESLKQNKGFSLLKACGRENNTDVDDHDTKNCDTENFGISMMKNDNMDKQIRFHFSAQNAFKHDWSDNKNVNETFNVDEQIVEQSENNNSLDNLFRYKDTLFFENDDVRFNEAVRFFSIEAASNNKFKNLRRELKVIVRTKIRRNERKYQPWSKKRKIKSS